MKKLFGYLVLCFSLIAISLSCNKHKVGDFAPVDVCTDTVFYKTIVEPIIMNNCAVTGCHVDLELTVPFSFQNGIYPEDTNKTYTVVSENANLILSAIQHNTGFVAMPKDAPKLSEADIKIIECWINQGKKNN